MSPSEWRSLLCEHEREDLDAAVVRKALSELDDWPVGDVVRVADAGIFEAVVLILRLGVKRELAPRTALVAARVLAEAGVIDPSDACDACADFIEIVADVRVADDADHLPIPSDAGISWGGFDADEYDVELDHGRLFDEEAVGVLVDETARSGFASSPDGSTGDASRDE